MILTPDIYAFAIIFLIEILAILLFYQVVYPIFAKNNITRLVLLDLIMVIGTLIAIYFVIGNYYILDKLPWWLVAIILGFILEYPFFISYCKKHKLC